MNLKSTIWKALTLFVVVFLILNPETVGLALFIDAVGLEIFMLMVELQIVALFTVFYQISMKPTISFIHRFRLSSQFFHTSSFAPAGLMHLVVLTSSLPLLFSCLT
ncbi:MAG: hypothetical protein ABW119_22425 [Candidatus Thiodiazotropha lotti]